MKGCVGALLFSVLLSAVAPAQDASTESPPRLDASASQTARAGPPFRMFSAWIDALNSDDPGRLPAFLTRHYPGVDPHGFDRLRENSRGLELRALDSATDTSVTGLVQERDSDNFLRFNLTLDAGEPERIASIEILYTARPADFPPPRMTEAEIFAALDAKLTADAARDRFSGVVLVTKHGAPVYRAARGMADREKALPNTLETRFNLGSMNKMFTATAIMQLVQQGKIALDAPLGRYLPDYPNRDVASKVTIEQLLTHTAGTGNIFGPDYDAHRLELQTHDDYLRLYGARGPSFEPGSRFEYSNYGPVLLGLVIERVTRRSYYDHVARKIFKPAGMHHTGSEPIDALLPGTAIGYMRADGGGKKPNFDILARGTAAGGGYSTAGDLTRFADALLANKLLSKANTQLMITGKVDLPRGKYAYGFLDMRGAGEGYVGHGGAAPGVNGDLRIFPDDGYVVVVLSNIDPPFAGRVGAWLTLRLDNRL